jgi:hypothetical protein
LAQSSAVIGSPAFRHWFASPKICLASRREDASSFAATGIDPNLTSTRMTSATPIALDLGSPPAEHVAPEVGTAIVVHTEEEDLCADIDFARIAGASVGITMPTASRNREYVASCL